MIEMEPVFGRGGAGEGAEDGAGEGGTYDD